MFKIIDCTFRDGGYYNNWDFDRKLIQEYLYVMSDANVDIVELGFRFFPSGKFMGATAFTTDGFIEGFDIPKNLCIAVMLNASDIVNYTAGPSAAIHALFDHSENSPVEMVRIAAHFKEISKIGPAIKTLHELGYRVGLNLMQIAERSSEEIKELSLMAANEPIEVLYFADSLGGLDPSGVAAIISNIKEYWKGPVGIHTHDNMGRALANSIEAIRCGATWIDATVLGMGRGPGNVRLEYLLIELSRLGIGRYNVTPVLGLLQKWFEPMQREYGWGPNPYYYLSGSYGIHPTYIQEMLSDPRYAQEDVLSAIEFLRSHGRESYSKSFLEASRNVFTGDSEGTFNAKNWAENREVLVITGTKGALRHAPAILEYIKRNRPVVIALNRTQVVPDEFLTARAACHPLRLTLDAPYYRGSRVPIFVPLARLDSALQSSFDDASTYDYGLSVEHDVFRFGHNQAVVPVPLVAAYALAISTAAGASRILLAGFDGYAGDDARGKEMERLFELYRGSAGSVQLIAITPTTYNISQSSVYAAQI